MKVLVLGADTPVGSALVDLLLSRSPAIGEREIIALPRQDMRWKSERQAKKALRRASADFVIDLRLQATIDAGDRLRDNEAERCRWLAKTCEAIGGSYLLVSSAVVFSGDSARRYSEADPADGQGSLARLVLDCEQAVRERCQRHIVLRLGVTFDAEGSNTLTFMLSSLLDGGPLQVGNRVAGCPVFAADAARVLSAIVDQLGTGLDSWGVYHYCSTDVTTCYEFAEVLLASASQFSDLPLAAVQLLDPAAERPMVNLALECTRIRNTFAIKQMPWRRYVGAGVKQYFKRRSA